MTESEKFLHPNYGSNKYIVYAFNDVNAILKTYTIWANDLEHAKMKTEFMDIEKLSGYSWHTVTTLDDPIDYSSLVE